MIETGDHEEDWTPDGSREGDGVVEGGGNSVMPVGLLFASEEDGMCE